MKIIIDYQGKTKEVESKDLQNAQDLANVMSELMHEPKRIDKNNTHGIKMTPEEQKALDGLIIYGEGGTVVNPFSGVEVKLSAEALSVYDLLKGCEVSGNSDMFFTARDVFIKNWPEHYSTLID